MKLLSWDVGVYNLAYCIIEKNENENPKILDWNIVNLVDNEQMKKNTNLLFENIPRKLYDIPQLLDVDIVVIENQPSLKNPKMKSIQMILYSYFLILGKTIGNDLTKSYIDKLDFCSASNKLKIYDGPEIVIPVSSRGKKKKEEDQKMVENLIEIDVHSSDDDEKIEVNLLVSGGEKVQEKKETKKKGSEIKYADKKKLAIEYAKYFVNKYNPSYLDFFNSHKKKDDLSDSYLQGLYYLKKLKK